MGKLLRVFLVLVLASQASADELDQYESEKSFDVIGEVLEAVELPVEVLNLCEKAKELEPDVFVLINGTEGPAVKAGFNQILQSLDKVGRQERARDCARVRSKIGKILREGGCQDDFFLDEYVIRLTYQNNEKARNVWYAWTACDIWLDISASSASVQELEECYTGIGHALEAIEIPEDVRALGDVVEAPRFELSDTLGFELGKNPSVEHKMRVLYDETDFEEAGKKDETCYDFLLEVYEAQRTGDCDHMWRRNEQARRSLLDMSEEVRDVFYAKVGCKMWRANYDKDPRHG